MKTAFIGHRDVSWKVKERLENVIRERIDAGCKSFIMGTHGDFDELALSVCRELRRTIEDIDITVVVTSFHKIEKISPQYSVSYSDVKTIMYNIEEVYPKKQIIESNRQMIDGCDTLICYVDETRTLSGAKTAMKYAKRKGLKIINLYKEEDNPYTGMTREELSDYIHKNYRDSGN